MTLFRWLMAACLTDCLGAVHAAGPRCLTDCTPRIGIVSAFGAEADILIAETRERRVHTVQGRRYTTGRLRGNRVVIVLSGVSMVNAALVTQQLIDHFRIQRLVMSGIAGGVDPANHVGDVTVPDRWAMPMEVFWNADSRLPAPCGTPTDLACLGCASPPGLTVGRCRPTSSRRRRARSRPASTCERTTCSARPPHPAVPSSSTTRSIPPCSRSRAACGPPCSAAVRGRRAPMAAWTRRSA